MPLNQVSEKVTNQTWWWILRLHHLRVRHLSVPLLISSKIQNLVSMIHSKPWWWCYLTKIFKLNQSRGASCNLWTVPRMRNSEKHNQPLHHNQLKSSLDTAASTVDVTAAVTGDQKVTKGYSYRRGERFVPDHKIPIYARCTVHQKYVEIISFLNNDITISQSTTLCQLIILHCNWDWRDKHISAVLEIRYKSQNKMFWTMYWKIIRRCTHLTAGCTPIIIEV